MKKEYTTPVAELIRMQVDRIICASLDAEPIHWDDEDIEY